ncbi:MAG: HRDC domain-containing protein [Bdellovibrionota bacterium]
MKIHNELLSTPQEIQALATALQGQSMIAVDTEFLRETTFYPVIGLIQIATETESWLVDPLRLENPDIQPLLDVFCDPKIVKVLHASQADQECLYTSYGVTATPSIDTAVAASLCGYGDSIGLSKLLKDVLGVHVPKGHARTDWTARPMQEHLKKYAHQDVQHLVKVAKKLLEQLDSKGRKAWAFELSARFEKKKNYEPNPEGIALKLVKSGRLDNRGYAALIELVRWRENRVRHLDVPRRRVADDDVLMDLAKVRPKNLDHLTAFRGLNKGELKASATALLEAIQKSEKLGESELPQVPTPAIPSLSEARAVEFLQCFVRILSDQLEISARHLITGDDLLFLLRRNVNTVEDMVKEGLLTEGAGRLIGEELLAMLKGKRQLSLRNNQVFLVEQA